MPSLLSEFIDAVKYSETDQRIYARVSAVACILLAGIAAHKGFDAPLIATGSAAMSAGAGSLASFFSRRAGHIAQQEAELERRADQAPICDYR